MNGQMEHSKGTRFIFKAILLWTGATLLAFLVYALYEISTQITRLELSAMAWETDRLESNIDYIELIMTYKLHRQLYLKQLDEGDFLQEELRKGTAAAHFYLEVQNHNAAAPPSPGKYSRLINSLFEGLNFIRSLLNKPPLYLNSLSPLEYYLDLGYYFERNKLYGRAVGLYDEALANHAELAADPRTALIILHRGYCSSVMGSFTPARTDYYTVINKYSHINQKAAITAGILLQYITDFEEEIRQVAGSGEQVTQRAEKLFQLMAIKKALELLENVRPGQLPDPDKARYYRARCLEESGQLEEALEEYQQLITSMPGSPYALLANRRIIGMSSYSASGEALRKLAGRNNELLGDPEYGAFMDLAQKGRQEELFRHLITLNPRTDNRVLEKNLLDLIARRDEINDWSRAAIFKNEQARQEKERELEKERTAALLVRLESLDRKIRSDTRRFRQEQKVLEVERDRIALLLQQKSTLQPENPDRESLPNSTEEVFIKDEKGRILRKTIYQLDEKGARSSRAYFLYHYDRQDNLIKISQFTRDDQLVSYYLFEYDEYGNRINVGHYNTAGELKLLDEMSY